MGKGSKPRPLSVERDTFAERWSQTFGARRELTRLLNPNRCPIATQEGE